MYKYVYVLCRRLRGKVLSSKLFFQLSAEKLRRRLKKHDHVHYACHVRYVVRMYLVVYTCTCISTVDAFYFF